MEAVREFLMLAQPYKEKKHDVKGWLVSEKLDGIRVLWDGGITRGLPKADVPWANVDKDERYLEQQISTGLWTRYGNLIHAPDWFLDQLPDHPLDGELFTDRKSWQRLSSIIKRLVPDDKAWESVTYNVFEMPPYPMIFQSGRTTNPNFRKVFNLQELMDWSRPRFKRQIMHANFASITKRIQDDFGNGDFPNIRPVPQTLVESKAQMMELYEQVLDLGGEGIIVRSPKSYWEPKRSHLQVKLKPSDDDEGVVTGYVWGRETDKGSKFLGMMGALVLDYRGKRLELSGFNDNERILMNNSFDSTVREDEGYAFPGTQATPAWYNPMFPIGTRVTFKYRELSNDGIPKEARYFRKRDSE